MSRIALPPIVSAALAAAMLAGCGAPPSARPSAPPLPVGGSADPSSGAGLPSGLQLPGVQPTGLQPTGGIPTGLLPTAQYPLPGTTTQPTTTPATGLPTTPTGPIPPAAPVCTAGPTKQQIIGLVEGKPGIPEDPLEVRLGPYCSGGWQFSILGIVGQSNDKVDPLLVVSSGAPTKLKLLEAGGDVCSARVVRDAPPGIRVRACGS